MAKKENGAKKTRPAAKKAGAAAKKANPNKAARLVSEGFPVAKFAMAEGVFYNPEMELCRDMFSLLVGSLGGKIALADAMCASGVRGLRYKIENKNVDALFLTDLSRRAVACARKNAKLNAARCAVSLKDAREFFWEERGNVDFAELDPFGSPMPFLYDAIRGFEGKKTGVLSVTATDMAVLCGANHPACLKNYGSAPLDNEFCHENAMRILLGKITLIAAQFNFGTEPLISFSHRHYVKAAVRLVQGADAAVASVKKMGYVLYCPACCWREATRLPRKNACPHCNHQIEIGGPMHIGALWGRETLDAMLKLNAKRDYPKKIQLEKILRTLCAESGIESHGYYDLHVLAKKRGTKIMGMDEALAAIREGGFAADRTHFCPTAIRTAAPHEEVLKRLGA